jgi:lipopolysaccharide export system permease protein
MIKTLDKFVLKSFVVPFILTFVVVLFVLLMQFVWKYVDDLVGKGLEWYIILQLLFYVSLTMIPLALPLAMLLSSNMAFGNLAERYELTAMKSSGISLNRIIRPVFILTIFISVGAFYFSNYIFPIVNLKESALLYDITHQKPSIDIREGVFYNGIENFTIKTSHKSRDGKWLYDILIYDHTQHLGNTKILMARKGSMEVTADENYLLFTLYDGHSYEDVYNRNNQKEFHPLLRSNFSKQIIRMDLRDFKMVRSDENLFKDSYQMLNVRQLMAEIDTQRNEIQNLHEQLNTELQHHLFNRDVRSIDYITTTQAHDKIRFNDSFDFLKKITPADRNILIDQAFTVLRSNESLSRINAEERRVRREQYGSYGIEFHKKFTLAFACLVLFFIGAPLGAIIKKGGLGMPVVVSVCFFLIFYVLSIVGEKSAKESAMTPFQGAWLASMVLLPIGIFLTYKATRDSVLFDMDSYKSFFKKIFSSKK